MKAHHYMCECGSENCNQSLEAVIYRRLSKLRKAKDEFIVSIDCFTKGTIIKKDKDLLLVKIP